MKKIVFFSNAPYFGGAEEYIFLLARNLGRELFVPTVLLWSGAQRIEEFEEKLTGSGIASYRHSFGREPTSKDSIDLYRLLRKLRPDILHINLPSSYDAGGGLAAFIGRAARARAIVFTEHLPSFDRSLRRHPLKKMSLLVADRVIAVCEATRGGLIKWHGANPGKVVTIHNGIEVNAVPEKETARELKKEFGFKEDSPLMGAVGELSPRKGHMYLLTALSRIAKERPDVTLAIVGEGELFRFLIEASKRLEIEKNVRFFGRRRDVRRFLSALDFLVLPSLHEGLPYVVLEAMAGGKPVIATSVFGVPEIIEDGVTGLLIQPRDVEGLSRGMLRLLDNSSERERMGELARKRVVERFSLSASVSKTEELYLELLVRKG